MTKIIPFPDRPVTGAQVEKLHAEAFRDLESRIADCATMAIIAVQLAERAIDGREAKHEKAMFAVCHAAEMLMKLKADYQTMCHEGDSE